jgi:hypothetical protein
VEVVMDLGRRPIARFPSGDWVISDQPVTADDLRQAVSKVARTLFFFPSTLCWMYRSRSYKEVALDPPRSFVYSKIRGGLDWNREDLILYKSYLDLILIVPAHSFSSPM